MSIKQVVCPQCNATMNVAASMGQVQCQKCQTVFVPGAAANTASASSATRPSKSATDGESSSKNQVVMFSGVAVAIAMSLLAVAIATSGSKDKNGSESVDPGAESEAAVVADAASKTPAAPSYEVVNLPDSTRQKLYGDYKAMMNRSVGKAKKLPGDGTAIKRFQALTGTIAEREVTRMALAHNISDDDFQQIIAEGEAKGW